MAFDSEVVLPAHVDPVQGFPLDVKNISWDKLNESDTGAFYEAINKLT